LRPYRDFNTRFSGVTPEIYSASALQPLAEIRRSLDELISSETILIGHALENDLKTLRMIHFRNVDTAVIFRHPAGPPYRRALRDLYVTSPMTTVCIISLILFRVKEYLGKAIQTGGANVGHSSLEDSIATLDLVKWHVINKPPPPPMRTAKPTPAAIASTSETPAPIVASTSTSTDTFTPTATPMPFWSQERQRAPPTADDIPF
jgi:RNA exonuclease 1